jgi:ABC-type nitrate/sulfonate/bicarbonate transport system ATPase subunit
MLSLVAAGPITWQLAMSSPFSEPVPAPGDLSEPLGRPGAGTDIPGPGLAISGVSRTYDTDEGPVAALGPVELHVPQGRFVTVIGPSGCGKSTLLRILAGIDRPDQGSISIFGESVEHTRRAKLIGFVPQALALLPWRTVLENARLPLELNRSGAANRREPARGPSEVLRALGLGDVLDRRPAELSGGMRQRVAIARAFVSEPALLLMDEPFSALDELTSEVLRRELLQLWHSTRTTVVFVSHSVSEAVLLSDQVVVMTPAPGRIATVIDVILERPRGDLVEVTDAFRDCEREVRLALRETWVTDQQAP